MSKKHAFTLIELLVVISIIALLIAILLPALKSARETGRSAVCLSNQRQIAMGMAVYSNENNSYFPQYLKFDQPVGQKQYWGYTLWRLGLLTVDAYICPTYQSLGAYSLEDATIEPTIDQESLAWSHYGYNFYHIGSSLRTPLLNGASPVQNPGYMTPARIEDVLRPSQTITLVDSEYNPLPPGYFSGNNTAGYHVVQDFSHPLLNPHARHSPGLDSVNVAWLDSHASTVKIADPNQPYVELTSFAISPQDNLWDRE